MEKKIIIIIDFDKVETADLLREIHFKLCFFKKKIKQRVILKYYD